MRTRCTLTLFAFAWSAWLVCANMAGAQTTPKASAETRWEFEVLGGLAPMSPDDFNAFSRYRHVAYVDYYDRLHDYYRSIYGTARFTGSTTMEGEFPRIEGGDSVVIRLGRPISRRLTVLAAFEYVRRTRSGDVTRSISSTTVNPDAVSFVNTDTTTFSFSNRRSVRSLSPMIGVRAQVLDWRTVSLDVQGLAGAAWGRARIEEDRHSSTTFYRLGSDSTIRMRGTSAGLNVEASARVAWRAWRGLSLIAEAGYQRLRLPKITGTVATNVQTQDGDATSVEKETAGSANGQWRMQPYRVDGLQLNQPYPYVGGTTNPAATLDLSGARLRVGAAIRFRRPF